MLRPFLRHRFGIGSVMVGVVLVSAVLSEVVRRSSYDSPVAQMTMGGDVGIDPIGGTLAGGSSMGGFSSAGGFSSMGGIGGDMGGIGGSSLAQSSTGGGSSAGISSSMGLIGGDIGVIGGVSSAAGQSSSAAPPSSAAPQSSSTPPASSSAGLSSPPPTPSSSAASSVVPRCGDGVTSPGESCDPCAPTGRTVTDPNCNALCSAGRCGDGFLDRRRGEECDYIGLLVEDPQSSSSSSVSRNESIFTKCTSDSACSGGYCLYGACWPLPWLGYWGWQDTATCPQTWSRLTANGTPTEPVGAPCNDFSNPRCREFLGDGCTLSCKLERCGDNVIQAGYTTSQGRHYGLAEECDDGNIFSGDGCSDRCTLEHLSSRMSIPASSASYALDFCEQFPHLCASASSGLSFAFTYSAPAAASSTPPASSSDPPPASSSAPAMAMRMPLCGDGALDPGEECDSGSGNSDTTSAACRTNCMRAHCGDFVADYPLGEQCDQGVGNSATEANRCRIDCSLPKCGDRVIDRSESCDDGNIAAGDGCTAYCTWETIAAIQPRCGDGRIQTGEQCDDGNSRGGDGCSIACQAEFVLGVAAQLDPVLVAGGVICGDGVLVEPEECDDGNPEPGDGCSPLCNIEPAVCGNGVFEPGEQCDDGNTLDTDGCNAQCQTVAPPKPAAPLAQIIPMPILEPPPYMYPPLRALVGKTGPAAIAVMASGAAAGVGWLRRKRRSK